VVLEPLTIAKPAPSVYHYKRVYTFSGLLKSSLSSGGSNQVLGTCATAFIRASRAVAVKLNDSNHPRAAEVAGDVKTLRSLSKLPIWAAAAVSDILLTMVNCCGICHMICPTNFGEEIFDLLANDRQE
jgi:hypothetical protein